MIFTSFKNVLRIGIVTMLSSVVLTQCQSAPPEKIKPRVLISSDIGGTDDDDYQSMIHLLMYANEVQIEGLVASPYGDGRTKNIIDMIDLYESDLPKLSEHRDGFPSPDFLREITKQGGLNNAPFKGFNKASEGSNWIVECANKKSDQPLWVLVWGGIEDLAQALHDAPEIENKIKVYWIGGPNKKWSVNAYSYIVKNHPDLWMIEANATYRGWFIDSESPEKLKNNTYYDNYIKGSSAMGKAFKNYYDGEIKMGDTPSLAYVINGDPNDPSGESWGGSFVPIDHSSRTIFEGNTTTADTVSVYGVLEWKFKGPQLTIPKDSVCFTMEISGQVWPGYYLGNGDYGVRYSSKKPEVGNYTTSSDITELDKLHGRFVSVNPWPAKIKPSDYKVGSDWYGDRPDTEFFLGVQQGAKTVSKYREEFLLDWAKRWEWLNE